MPQVEIVVGSRSYEIACQPGEEDPLRDAAGLLDAEAASIHAQVGRMPEAKMLLMSGLLLADRMAGLERLLLDAQARAEAAEAALAALEAQGPVEVRVEVPVEVAVTPPEVVLLLDDVARGAEAVARQMGSLAAR